MIAPLFAHTSIVLERKKNSGPQEIGRSTGGLSTKIHVLTDALGNPTRFFLSPGMAHDLVGADALLSDVKSCSLLADKAYGSEDRMVKPLESRGIKVVIPSKKTL